MRHPFTVGVDVGGTKIRAGLVSSSGKILVNVKIATEAKKGRAAVLKNIEKAVGGVWDDRAGAVGIGLAGMVDSAKGIYVQGPNLPKNFASVPLADLIRRRFKVKTRIDNDVHCFTLAEAKFGSGKGRSRVVGLTFGTGVGGGIVLDGEPYKGRNNAAGEIGHMVVDLGSDLVCGCGRKGHLEAYASGTAMSRIYEGRTGEKLDAIGVEAAAQRRDPDALATMDIMAGGLAAGLANIVHTLNPDIIVVGGGLANVPLLWRPAMRRLRSLVIFPALRDTPVVRASLGPDANVLGAALLAR